MIVYGKPLPAGDDMILIAVSLDPFHVQEVTIEVPLWEWKLSDNAAVAVDGPDAGATLRLARQIAAHTARSGRTALRDLAHRTSPRRLAMNAR